MNGVKIRKKLENCNIDKEMRSQSEEKLRKSIKVNASQDAIVKNTRDGRNERRTRRHTL